MAQSDAEIAQLRAGIAALESQRAILGDAVVDASVRPLRDRLAVLQALAQPAQRKLATVLFADISGFTTIAETMDAEVVAGIMNDLWLLVDQAITDHGGRIDKHIGDAVMAMWGAGAAREDDPEMAVRGALAMQAAIDRFCKTHRVPLAMRVGVNTGPVLLGAIGTTGEFTAMGDAVNLASRLEHAAPVGGVLISHDTYRHVRGVFDVVSQEPLVVKGKSEPVQTYVVLRAKPRAFRVAARGVEGVETRMIGRDHELGLLQEAYTAAIGAGETRLVTIVGEAGVGKSRLLYEFNNWVELRPEGVAYFKGRCTPNAQDVPYALFRDLFAFRFEILDSDSVAVALAKFQAGMGGIIEPDQAAIVGHWLGFDFSSSAAVRQLLGGSGFAETARAYLNRYFRGLLAGTAAIVLLEDIHWADDLSLDLILHLAGSLPAAQQLFVAVTRPILFERWPDWGEGEATFTRVNLTPLPRDASRALVDEILQRVTDVPDSLRDLIIDAAEGNPFYVEEMVKMLIDQGVIETELSGRSSVSGDVPKATTGWRVRTEKLAGLRVPPTLTGLLQARLDGLPKPEREVLQRAAVVGRLFWDEAVAELTHTPLEDLRPALDGVRRRELIFRRDNSSFAAAEEFVFRHALLRDVAYETVLLKDRAELHARAARWLEANAGERLGEYLGRIADHYEQAHQELRAAEMLERSGQESLKVGAYAMARRSLERAMALREIAGERDSHAATLAAIGLGLAYTRLGALGQAEQTLASGLVGARAAGNLAAEVEALAYLARVADRRGNYPVARARAEEALALSLRIGDRPLAIAQLEVANVALSAGDMATAEAHAGEAAKAARATGSLDLEIDSLNALGNAAATRRELERSGIHFEQVRSLARGMNHLALEASAIANLGNVAYLRGDYATARAFGAEAVDRCRELGNQALLWIALINAAQAAVRLDEPGAARRNAIEVLALSQDLGISPGLTWGVFLLGQILIAEGEPGRGLALLGLVRAHPASDNQILVEIEEEVSALARDGVATSAGLDAAATLDFDTVVQEILDGKW